MINKYENDRTKIGNFFYKLSYKAAQFLMRHLWLYWLLHYTWALPVTIVTWIIWLCALPFSKQRGKFGPAFYQMTGKNWGGVSLGHNFIVANEMGDKYTAECMRHELGHTFQTALFGVFTVFLVIIPSAVRYWLSRWNKLNTPYDLAWFEGSATEIGNYYFEK